MRLGTGRTICLRYRTRHADRFVGSTRLQGPQTITTRTRPGFAIGKKTAIVRHRLHHNAVRVSAERIGLDYQSSRRYATTDGPYPMFVLTFARSDQEMPCRAGRYVEVILLLSGSKRTYYFPLRLPNARTCAVHESRSSRL